MEMEGGPMIEPENMRPRQNPWTGKGPIPSGVDTSIITHNWFPQDFLFGAATASYQVEGAAAKGGRGISIWDDFCLRTPEKIANGANGVVACDMYNTYKEDIQMMKQMGFNSYRDDFREFAEVCFWEFGDRVKLWSTLNEPATFAVNGYCTGAHAPGKKLPGSDTNPADVATPKDAYIVARNLLLAHAEAVQLYRTKFQKSQHGKIGMVINSYWCLPYNKNSKADQDAAYRAIDFTLGWFLEPVLYGRFPESMVQYVPPDNLPCLTRHGIEMLEDSIDFLGLNYYTARYVKDNPDAKDEGFTGDQKADLVTKGPDNVDIGKAAPGATWVNVVPYGIYYLLEYIQKKYPTLKEIYITENGYADKDNPDLTAVKASNDICRKEYHQDHLANLWKVMKDNKKVNVKGYYVWSWCDNFEWDDGYNPRFGLIYIDYQNDLTRYPKESAKWFATFMKSNVKPPLWAKLSSGKRSMEEDID